MENGRTMTEMLGVLAIIGVLSIGGISGYSYAMNKHRANQIVNEIRIINVDFATTLMVRNNNGTTLNLDSPYSQNKLEFGDYMFDWACGDGSLGKECMPGEEVYRMALGIENNKELCEQLVEMIPFLQYYSEHTIYGGNEFAESEECSESNVIEIAFQVDAGVGESIPGPDLDPDQDPAQKQPVCPDNAPYWNQDSEECEACPNGKYWGKRTNSDGNLNGAEGCWDCHYSKNTPYWNGHLCLSCPQNTVLSYVDDNGFRLYSCQSTCPDGYMWARRDRNNYSSLSLEEGCISCENLGMIWDESRETCLPDPSCAEGEIWSYGTCSLCSEVGAGTMPYWNGYFCDKCPDNTYWDTNRCCNCNDSSTPFFNAKTGQCEACPEGTSWDSGACACD